MAFTGGVGLGAGTATGAEAAAPDCDGMNGLTGAPVAGWGLAPDDLRSGEASEVGAVVVCAKATGIAKCAQISPPISRAQNFIEPTRASGSR